MFGFRPKLPITEEQRVWIDEGFSRLEKLLGRTRMTDTEVVLPNDSFFPDRYDQSTDSAHRLFQRLCTLMQVDPSTIALDLFPDATDELREVVPVWSSRGHARQCAAGLYYRPDESAQDKRAEISLLHSLLKNPARLIATIAHELGHAILLGGNLIDPDTPDHEPLTDLLTVFLGLGILTANAAAHFQQFTEAGRQGWSMSDWAIWVRKSTATRSRNSQPRGASRSPGGLAISLPTYGYI